MPAPRSRAPVTSVVALLAAALVSCAGGGTPDLDVVGTPQVAAPVAGSSQVAVTVANDGDGDDVLVGAGTDAALAAEIHRTTVADGAAVMEVLEEVPIPAGEQLVFRPGELHLMLVVPDETVREGGTLRLVLEFERSGDVVVDATVVDLLDLAEDAADAREAEDA
ncbi:MAG: copper chaperone PCu(A)C [Nitriliruptor sp.]|uniref:copper chaperone PCu(A)C n=1 Tax=Nitriliruptor sp. TaxID=2448056 RepID=UPI0034A0906B